MVPLATSAALVVAKVVGKRSCRRELEIYFYFEIVRRSGAVFVSQASFITVATGVARGVIFFGEEHGPWIWASMAILASSVYLSTRNGQVAPA